MTANLISSTNLKRIVSSTPRTPQYSTGSHRISPHRMAHPHANRPTDGVFAINKPKGLSSAQVIRDCQHFFNPSAMFAPALRREAETRAREGQKAFRRRTPAKARIQVKMGHGGTLDPLASGVLILALGSGTKSLTSFLECTKEYEAVVVFGARSDTQDRVGKTISRESYSHITRELVEKTLQEFMGKITQTPPIFSAIKMDGKPLYEYARSGQALPREVPTREVVVDKIELLEWYEPGTHRHFWAPVDASDEERVLSGMVEKAVGNKTQPTEAALAAITSVEPTPAAELSAKTEPAKATTEATEPAISKEREDEVRDEAAQAARNVPKDKRGPPPKGKGTGLVPETDPDAPPPWGADVTGPPAAKIRITSSSGFYVRSLCDDLGLKLGSGALMAELVRTRQSDFLLGKNVMDYDILHKGEDVWGDVVAGLLKYWAENGGNGNGVEKRPAVVGRKGGGVLLGDGETIQGGLVGGEKGGKKEEMREKLGVVESFI